MIESPVKHIAVLIPNLNGGGAERVTANLIAALVRRGVEVDLLLIRAEGPNLSRIPPQVRIIELAANRTLLAARPLAAYLKQHRPAALLAVMDSAAVVAAVAKRLARVDTRIVAVLHNATVMRAAAKVPLHDKWLPIALRSQLWLADAVVAVSQGLAEEQRELFPWLRSKVQVIYNPVVTAELLQKALDPPDHPWLQPDQPPVVVGMGRLCAAKDFATLIQAFALLVRTRPVRMLLYGDGELRAELLAQVAALGLQDSVQLPGWTDQSAAVLRHAAVFALSSEYEALPTVLIEALACGTQVVATDCRFGPREILQDGQLGPLVATRDAPALAAALAKALDQPIAAARLQQRAQDFSESVCTAQYLQVLLAELPA